MLFIISIFVSRFIMWDICSSLFSWGSFGVCLRSFFIASFFSMGESISTSFRASYMGGTKMISLARMRWWMRRYEMRGRIGR